MKKNNRDKRNRDKRNQDKQMMNLVFWITLAVGLVALVFLLADVMTCLVF
jgi:hypothetical protein